MAASSSHARSVSWPDNVHPLTRSIEDHLFTLTTCSTLPQSSICRKLGFLRNLYEVVDDFLHLPLTRESRADLEHVSDGFLQVLDICCTARDVFMQTKEDIRELESAIRRRSTKSGGEEALARKVDAFVSRRRAMNRTVSRFTKPAMKRTEKNKRDSRQDLLKEVQEASFGVFLGLLLFVSQSEKQRLKRKNWNFVFSKMFQSSKSSSTEQSGEDGDTEEVLVVTEAELEGLKSGNGVVCGEELQRLREVEVKIEEIERELEGVYRMLVKTRVSLLNILNI